MAEPKMVKIFVASSAELKEERDKCIVLINQLNNSHKHLVLKPVEWEYDLVYGNYPGYKDAQAAISPKLQESDLAVFLFYSRIGKYTREEFELAGTEKKKIIPFFKSGFSAKTSAINKMYGELLEFREGFNGEIISVDYVDLNDFKGKCYEQLNQFLADSFPITNVESVSDNKFSESISTLAQLLAKKDEKIKELEEANKNLPGAANYQSTEELAKERDILYQKLLQSQEIQDQQAKDKEALQQQLNAQEELDELKQKAYAEVEKGNYSEAEKYLKESAKDTISKTANSFFEFAKLKNLQLQYADAFQYYDLAIRINPDNVLYLNDAGIMAINLGFTDKAIEYYQKILATNNQSENKENIDLAVCYNNLGEAYRSKEENAKAIEYYEQAIYIDTAKFGDAYWKLGTYYSNLGLAYDSTGKYDAAIECYEKALSIYKDTIGEESENAAKALNNLGLAYYRKGLYDDAVATCEKALSVYQKLYPGGHPDMAACNNSIGLVYYATGKFDEAIVCFEKALEISIKYYGTTHPNIATWYNNLGLAYDGKKEYDTAIDYYKAALDIDKQHYTEDHPNMALRYNNLGGSYNNTGKPDEAIDYFGKALVIYKKFYGDEHPSIATLLDNMGLSFYMKEEYSKAVDYFEQSLMMMKKFLPGNHPYLFTVQQNIDLSKEALQMQA